jgi:hypothetical protein
LLVCLVPAIAAAQPRDGLTIEANTGLGKIRVSPATAPSYTSGIAFALDGGVAVWLSNELALGGRFAGLTTFSEGETLGAYFLGPSVQFWLNDRWWLGGGAGLGLLAATSAPNELGFAFDARVGYVLSADDTRVLTGSLDITPARFSSQGDAATLTSIALLLGLQYF